MIKHSRLHLTECQIIYIRKRTPYMAAQASSLLLLLLLAFVQGTSEQASSEDEDYRAGCRTAANELVFLLDGSWSVEPENFETVKQWLVNISSSFDIGPEYTLVSVIQYSDAPQLEISLAAHKSSERLIAAISDILYMGGNTQTGRSIQFVTKQVFPVSPRASAVLVRTVVVVTDGKSQDNVTVAALEAREKGITLFAIGVGNEVEEAELKEIANKPSSSYVFYVEDYGAISRIKEVIKQKICEETVCPTRIPSRGRDEKGFDLLEGLRVMEKAEPAEGSLQDVEAYSIGSKIDLTEKTWEILPEGLPPSYLFVATLQSDPLARRDQWDLWRVLAKDGSIQVAVTMNGPQRSLSFSTTSALQETQTVTFSGHSVQKLYDGEWHQIRLLVSERRVTLFVDNRELQEKELEKVLPIYVRGLMQVGKYVGKDSSVQFTIQKLRIYCDPEQNKRETSCELPFVCEEDRLPPAQAPPCVCPPGSPGPAGQEGKQGKQGKPGVKGSPGADGKPGPLGKQGKRGHAGSPGDKGTRGPKGPPGLNGRKGKMGERGHPGNPGHEGPPGFKGVPGVQGKPGLHGPQGSKGNRGLNGAPGVPAPRGATGAPGRNGKNGLPGTAGPKGNAGSDGIPGADGARGLPGIAGIPGMDGKPGQKGERGFPGSKGDRGRLGMRGNTGPRGSLGLVGPPGKKGMPGHAGLLGKRGIPGKQGYRGIPGLPGQPAAPGFPGIHGEKGERGIPGRKGSKSEKGSSGSSGIQGPKGSIGPWGRKGERGNSGPPGIPGRVGLSGEMGQQGPMGPPGQRGQIGERGVPGAAGIKGNPGSMLSDEHVRKVCFDLLRTQLPSLLQNAMPCSCQHRTGLPGIPGPPGTRGSSGSRGPQGYPGRAGQAGDSGIPGKLGKKGEKGEAGRNGEKGLRGVGNLGPQGPLGHPGPPGLPGQAKGGHPGKPGLPGKKGEPGERGTSGYTGPAGVCSPNMCYMASILAQNSFSKGPKY